MSDNEREEDPTDQPRIDPEARERELAAKYPNRPRNRAPTLPFHTLYENLFNPLNENRKPKNPAITKTHRRQVGPNVQSQSKTELRRAIIERYISRWRQAVGDDIFPALRLILPDKDRERAMYGLKEKVLARYIIKILQIDRNSTDGWSLSNWKLSQGDQNQSAGDFPSRCHDVISKRSLFDKPGNMTIDEVNAQLDKLSASAKEEDQLPILRTFYQRMNADEMTWLIRIILRAMKIGATEKTFFDIWHPDAHALYNVSSSLRRVCWDLWSPNIRLESEDCGIVHLMECFQPQLAQTNENFTFPVILRKLRPLEDDIEFWIEEKLDGERMQLHMITDPDTPGGKKFKFWSRKAKDYTYLYGESFEDPNGTLTRHLKPVFADGVDNIILDGEMITWDAELDMVMPFGTLKSAALSEQRNPFAGKARPLFKVFDILLLNDTPLTRYTLRDRRRALERAVKPEHRRLELHEYQVGTQEKEIEDALRKMVETASEGLVVKNPRSMYLLNDRNDDWIKVKPEYMKEFGESLDCVIIGGYYGSGRRGGALSSFLCGLRVEESWAKTNEWHEDLFWSFFKVGGGLNSNDYATIKHHTEDKWHVWDAKHPPSRHIELAAEGRVLFERPDVWIKPQDSVVVEVKAAQITTSDTFRVGKTLRFPRFVRLRGDKDWTSALSIEGLIQLQEEAEKKRHKNQMETDQKRKEKRRKLNSQARAQPLHVVGYGLKRETSSQSIMPSTMSSTAVTSQTFRGLTFYIMTESIVPEKRSKPQLETLVKSHGGQVVQINKSSMGSPVICIASRRTVKVASLEKQGGTNILKPAWLFDCITQSRADSAQGLDRFLVPVEPDRHLFFLGDDSDRERFADNVDEHGDSFARDTSVEELKSVFEKMGKVKSKKLKADEIMDHIREDDDYQQGRTNMFHGLRFYFSIPSQKHKEPRKHHDTDDAHDTNDNNDDQDMTDTNDDPNTPSPTTTTTILATSTARFAGASLAATLSRTEGITHIIHFASTSTSSYSPAPRTTSQDHAPSSLQGLRKEISTWPLKHTPRIVDASWLDACWEARTRVDEERYAPLAR